MRRGRARACAGGYEARARDEGLAGHRWESGVWARQQGCSSRLILVSQVLNQNRHRLRPGHSCWPSVAQYTPAVPPHAGACACALPLPPPERCCWICRGLLCMKLARDMRSPPAAWAGDSAVLPLPGRVPRRAAEPGVPLLAPGAAAEGGGAPGEGFAAEPGAAGQWEGHRRSCELCRHMLAENRCWCSILPPMAVPA